MSLKKNVIANYVGQGWAAVMGLAFVPIYIQYLGMEAYGLIGIFTVLQAWMTLLDMGMTPTLNREMARYTAGAHTAQSIRDLLRSLEIICFAIAPLIGITIWFLAPWLSSHWLQADRLPAEKVAQALSIMGGVVALRFIESLYRGAILGLQKQVWLNITGSSLATLRAVGAIFVLAWISPSIEAFFIWQGLLSILTIILFIFETYRQLPPNLQPARFSWLQMRNIWRFAGGVMATTLLSLLLMQVDKIVLSRILSLEMFGYYTLAGSIAATLYQLAGPITQAFYPRFTELVIKKDTARLIIIFHQAAQMVSVLIIPAALMLMLFGEDILTLWTGDAKLAHEIGPLLILLTLGTMLHGLMHVPYILTLAYNWPGLGVRQNIVAVIILVPAILWVTPRYGAIGAAWVWVILNTGYILIAAHFIYKRLMPDEKWRWYLDDITYPLAAALIVACILGSIRPSFLMKLTELAWLVLSGFIVITAAILAAPTTRKFLLKFIQGDRKHA